MISKDTFPKILKDLPIFVQKQLSIYSNINLIDMSVVKREIRHKLDWIFYRAIQTKLLETKPEVFIVEYVDDTLVKCLMVDIDHPVFKDTALL